MKHDSSPNNCRKCKEHARKEEALKELEHLKKALLPLYEFRDFGNYPALVGMVKNLQTYMLECETML